MDSYASRFLLRFASACGILLSSGLLFDLIATKIPVHQHWLFADNRDPLRPGHMKGMVVTTTDLVIEFGATVVVLLTTLLVWRILRRLNQVAPTNRP